MATAGTIVSKDFLEKLLDTEKLKYCYECGICTASCPMADLMGKDYNPRSIVGKILSDPEGLLASDALWLCAWCYRCYKRCNQALKLPEIFLLMRKLAVEKGHTASIEKAFQKIAENVPLPLITTLACFHPERAGLNREETLAKIAHMHEDYLKSEKIKRAQTVSEERIAIIGSGPAGLTVAYELSRRGYGVTVFEAMHEVGGMLRKCLPCFRLPRNFLDMEIQALKDLGVDIKTDTAIGHEMNLNSLWREGFKAVFIGLGAHKTQNLKIEGVELKGVAHALDFLWEINSGKGMEIGANVVVIGGGNVAVDAAREALKKGAKEVVILYRRSREEMPAIPWEVEEAEHEGVKIEFLVSPKKILGEDGRVSAVECVHMELGEPDESGRRRAISIVGSEFKRETDMVILAIGEVPDVEFLPKEILLDDGGTVWVDPVTMETTLQGVFAGGDAVTGPATVIEAICGGKRAAESIDKYLKSLRR
ncbi:MAG TPA: FAD-dependent oxidoreductase [Candidatus Bathyarchaeia archaeon]|nr:FAD-dependent oxidoreductase [Candidatus Bathyarchaeia archaeon]